MNGVLESIKVFAINNFGAEEGHPVADNNNLHHFKVPYVKDCLQNLINATEKVTDLAKDHARQALEHLHLQEHKGE